jgi:sn-glycerol 3-phosphate transport system substrate-binding protein
MGDRLNIYSPAMLRNVRIVALLLACLQGLAWGAPPRQEIRLWHAMNGVPGWELEQLAARFNASQSEFRLVVSYKGGAEYTVASALSARASASGPHLVQVPDVATADFMARKGVARPLWQLMAESGRPADARLLPSVAGYFSDDQGRLLALPLTAATPVLYYNRDAFRFALLDADKAPNTWYEMPRTLEALYASGSSCPFTTAWPSWILLENMSAWHDEEFATHDNGMEGADARLSFNGRLMVRWIAMLSSWLKSGYFVYSGRENEAEARFVSGECAILTSSSASYWALRARAKFDLGVAHLPYYDDFAAAPQNTLVGGAGLWAMAGKPKQQNRGVARFISYVLRPEVQAEWHQRTAYAPVTSAAYDLTRKKGFYEDHPGHDIAVNQLLLRSPTPNSRGIRLAHFREIRAIINEELEAVWGNYKTPLEALNAAVARGNLVLLQAAGEERD